jgi:uncharacterized protein YbcI
VFLSPSGLALRLARELPTGGRESRLAAMAAVEPPDRDVLALVTDAMIALHERYHHRKPLTARTRLLGDDLLVCVLGGVYTDVEKTMIELQKSTIVQETRSAFQTAMQQKFIIEVERITGRHVLAFISNQHVGPDMEIEIFMLEPPG